MDELSLIAPLQMRNKKRRSTFTRFASNTGTTGSSLEGAEMQQKTNRLAVPYKQGASEVVARILSSHGVLVAHKPLKIPRTTLMRPKDPLEPNAKSSIIYGLECGQCMLKKLTNV